MKFEDYLTEAAPQIIDGSGDKKSGLEFGPEQVAHIKIKGWQSTGYGVVEAEGFRKNQFGKDIFLLAGRFAKRVGGGVWVNVSVIRIEPKTNDVFVLQNEELEKSNKIKWDRNRIDLLRVFNTDILPIA